MNFKKRATQAGNTIAMVLVVAGVVAGLSTLLVKLTGVQTKSQIKLDSKIATETLLYEINEVLLNEQSCLKSIGAVKDLVTSKAISKILNTNGDILFRTSTGAAKYIDNLVSIKAMSLKTPVNLKTLSNGTVRFVDLVLSVTTVAANKMISATRERTLTIPIKAKVSKPAAGGDTVLNTCFSSNESVVFESTKSLCRGIGGNYNTADGKCTLASYPDVAPSPPYEAPSGENSYTAVSTNYLDQLFKYFGQFFVNRSGDTMTGTLNLPSNTATARSMRANANVCVGSNCRNYRTKRCSPGQIVVGVKGNGELICKTISCPSRTYFNGFKADGSVDCKSVPSKSCSVNQYVSEVKADGTIICTNLPAPAAIVCPEGQYIERISATGVPTCKVASVDTNTNILGKSCTSERGVLTGVTSTGALICADYCMNCGKCGITRSVSTTCNPGQIKYGTDQCQATGWVRIANPWCYCPCGTCGATRSVSISCSLGSPRYGQDRCETYGWVRVSNPWCYCPCGTCGATRTWTSGTTVYRQQCRTSGWVYY